MIGGVCGGLGRYWNIDPVLLRVVTGVLILATGGLLLVAYGLAWLLVPNEPVAIGGPGFASGGSPEYANPLYASPAGPAEPRSPLGWIVLGGAVALAGVLGLANRLGADIPVVTIIGLVLAVIGSGLVVGAFRGRARWLLAVAIPLVLIGGLATAVGSHMRFGHWGDWDEGRFGQDFRGPGMRGDSGDRLWRVGPRTSFPASFESALGNATLDLTGLSSDGAAGAGPSASTGPSASASASGSPSPDPTSAPADRGERQISVEMSAGNLLVRVPADLEVQLSVDSRAGEVILDGTTLSSGTNNDLSMLVGSLAPATSAVRLDVELGVGTVEVRREAA
jgi:phage shock protein PspC (stress-responsive transcriptional regulator)